MRRMFRGCLVLVGVLAALLAVMIVIGALVGDAPPAQVAREPTPTPVPTATATPGPTVTPVPTPTVTPVPTRVPTRVATPASTPTPAPTVAPECPTSAELDYMIELADLMGNISSSNLEIATLLTPVKANPEILRAPVFRETFVLHAAFVAANADRVIQMQPAPTPRLSALGATAELMARYFITGMKQMANGIDAQDLDQLGEGVSMAQLATKTLATAQELAGSVCARGER